MNSKQLIAVIIALGLLLAAVIYGDRLTSALFFDGSGTSPAPVSPCAQTEEVMTPVSKAAATAVAAADGVDVLYTAPGTDVETSAGKTEAGETLELITEGSRLCIVMKNGFAGVLPRQALLIGDDVPYEPRTGLALLGAKLYESWRLNGENAVLTAGTELTVLFKYTGGLCVRTADGEIGFVPAGQLGFEAMSAVSPANASAASGEAAGVQDTNENEWPEWTEPIR